MARSGAGGAPGARNRRGRKVRMADLVKEEWDGGCGIRTPHHPSSWRRCSRGRGEQSQRLARVRDAPTASVGSLKVKGPGSLTGSSSGLGCEARGGQGGRDGQPGSPQRLHDLILLAGNTARAAVVFGVVADLYVQGCLLICKHACRHVTHSRTRHHAQHHPRGELVWTQQQWYNTT